MSRFDLFIPKVFKNNFIGSTNSSLSSSFSPLSYWKLIKSKVFEPQRVPTNVPMQQLLFFCLFYYLPTLILVSPFKVLTTLSFLSVFFLSLSFHCFHYLSLCSREELFQFFMRRELLTSFCCISEEKRCRARENNFTFLRKCIRF